MQNIVCGVLSIRPTGAVLSIAVLWSMQWIVFALTSLNATNVNTVWYMAPYVCLVLPLSLVLSRKRKQMGDYYRPLGSNAAGLALCILLVLGTVAGVYYYGYAIVELVVWNILAVSTVMFVYFVTTRNRATSSTDNSVHRL